MDDRSRYIVELVAEEQQFAAGTKKAVADLNKVGDAAARLDRSRLASLKAQAAAEERLKRFNRLSDTQKLVVLEERRLNLARQLAYAEARGSGRQASIIRNRMAGLDEIAAGIGANAGAGTGRGGRGGKRGLAAYGARGLIQGLSTAGGMGLGEVAEVSAMAAAVYAIGRTIVSVFTEAYERSEAVKKQVEENRKSLMPSEGATEQLATLVGMLSMAWDGFKKVLAEVLAFLVSGLQGVGGAMAVVWGKTAKAVGLRKFGQRLEDTGETMFANIYGNTPKLPKWLGGYGGLGGMFQSGAVAGDAKVKKEEEERKKERARERLALLKSEASGIGSFFGSAGGQQGLASAGLFVAGGQQGLNARLLSIQGEMLAEIRAEVRATQAVERAVKETGV